MKVFQESDLFLSGAVVDLPVPSDECQELFLWTVSSRGGGSPYIQEC